MPKVLILFSSPFFPVDPFHSVNSLLFQSSCYFLHPRISRCSLSCSRRILLNILRGALSSLLPHDLTNSNIPLDFWHLFMMNKELTWCINPQLGGTGDFWSRFSSLAFAKPMTIYKIVVSRQDPHWVLSAGPAEPRFFNEVVTPPPHPFPAWLVTGSSWFI